MFFNSKCLKNFIPYFPTKKTYIKQISKAKTIFEENDTIIIQVTLGIIVEIFNKISNSTWVLTNSLW